MPSPRAHPVLQPLRQRFPEGAAFEIEPGAPQRAAAETFVRKVFWRHHGAHVGDVAPSLLACARGSRLQAVAGWRGARHERFFLERYLDDPIEVALSRAVGAQVSRWEVAEVGNFAAARPAAGIRLMRELVEVLAQRDFSWLAFTATGAVRRMLRKADIPLWTIAQADPMRLGPAARAWGDYYRCDPVVVACRLRDALQRARERT